ncbi:type I restriction endonuclease subunit R [Fulvitalea axinellae]|uniref:type I restriction endonuclease subunit R n=1 Tax=Fulvitalea axinellae TaxID=1182444 RepID=UPI0030CA503C
MHQPEYTESELPAIELFQALGYEYKHGQDIVREGIHEVLLKDRLEASIRRLNPWLGENQIGQAVREVSFPSYASLMEANEFFWHKLLCRDEATTQLEDRGNGNRKRDVRYIDFEDAGGNDWLVVNQMKFKGEGANSVPDLLVYVNGFPMAVLECKAPGAKGAMDQAIGDLGYYQKNSERLFIYNFLCAGLCKWQARYGAISSPSQFYSRYRLKEHGTVERVTGRSSTEQDVLIYSLFRKESFLDILRYFTLFELEEGRTIKKLPRYQQVRATNEVVAHLQEKDRGGVVWATQGSGKSLTMAYVIRKLRSDAFGFDNPTVLLLTDRKDLDDQIFNTFCNIGMQSVGKATSVADLKERLKNDYGKIITTTIQKFQETDDRGNTVRVYADRNGQRQNIFVREVVENESGEVIKSERRISEDGKNPFGFEVLSKKKNIYVLIDEAHRSQYNLLAAFMRQSLPHAKFVAFTGTPLSKDDKSTLGTFYGGDYLDVYTIKEAVDDGATLPLLYEPGLPEFYIDKEGLNDSFETHFGHESKKRQDKLQKEALKQKKYNESRLEAIAEHLLAHYLERVRADGLKAMLVCENRAMAIAYQKIFCRTRAEGRHDLNTRVVMSFSPKKDPQEYYEYATPAEEAKTASENYKLPFGDESETEKSGKLKYNNDAILIVSDMLLTGYDAPIAGALYLDKSLKEHTLLQALARVNRTRKGKKVGLIVDYYGITDHLIQALEIFSGDIGREEVIADFESEFPKLEQRHALLVQRFRAIKTDRNYDRAKYIDEAVRYLEPMDIRDDFKDLLKAFNESMTIVTPHPFALKYKNDLKLYNEIKLQARNMYPDDDQLTITEEESEKLRRLINEHLEATGVKNLVEEPVSIIDRKKFEEEMSKTLSVESKAKMISNRAKHVIQVNMDRNPDFYKPLAQRLEELIEMHKAQRISQLELFQKVQEEIVKPMEDKERVSEDLGFTARQFAVFNTLGLHCKEEAENLTRQVFEAIEEELRIIDWQDKFAVLKDMEKKMRKVLRGKLEREELRKLLPHLVDVIKKNA